MEVLGISVFDLVVLGVFSLTALIGLATGIVRSGLFIASWFLAILATLYIYPSAVGIAGSFFAKDWVIMLTAGLIPFIVVLAVSSFVSQSICKRVQEGRHNGLDRGLGMIAGLAAGASVLALVYIPIEAHYAVNPEPDWVRDALSKPMVEQLSAFARDTLPTDLFDRSSEPINRRAAQIGGDTN